jgi:CRP-like cAMP-binding protein
MLDEGRLLGHEQRISGPVERVLLLKRLQIASTLTGPQLALVAEQIGERFFPKGSVLLREGEAPGALYFPVEGRIHLTRGGRVIGHAGPGLAVGPFQVLARDERGLGAVAETDTSPSSSARTRCSRSSTSTSRSSSTSCARCRARSWSTS